MVLSIVLALAAGAGGTSGERRGDGAEIITLPSVPEKGDVSVEEAIWRRRSVRGFTGEAPAPEIVSLLCWAAQGITDSVESLRSAPSAGATYPLELFLATHEYVARYVPKKHHLIVTMRKDVRGGLARAALSQKWIAEAPMVFVFAGDVSRTALHYGDRATMYVHIEVGCASENLMLEAAALGWGSTAVGAFYDDEVRDVLALPKGWEAFLIVPVGRPDESNR